MLDYDDIADAEAGEERDAIRRAFAEDMMEMTSPRRPELVRAERSADLARAPGRDRRRVRPVRLAS